MRLILVLLFAFVAIAACGSSDESGQDEAATTDRSVTTTTMGTVAEDSSELGPGGYGFDRSDPAAGIADIMEAFAADEDTATCIYEAWGDVANIPPAELTPELMTFEICGTSIFQLMTGDPRFTGSDG